MCRPRRLQTDTNNRRLPNTGEGGPGAAHDNMKHMETHGNMHGAPAMTKPLVASSVSPAAYRCGQGVHHGAHPANAVQHGHAMGPATATNNSRPTNRATTGATTTTTTTGRCCPVCPVSEGRVGPWQACKLLQSLRPRLAPEPKPAEGPRVPWGRGRFRGSAVVTGTIPAGRGTASSASPGLPRARGVGGWRSRWRSRRLHTSTRRGPRLDVVAAPRQRGTGGTGARST